MIRKFTLIFVIFAALTTVAFAQADGLTGEQIDELAEKVVLIYALDAAGEPISSGSGTIVNSTGQIFTNAHVVDEGENFAIFMLEDVNELPVLSYFATVQAIFDQMDFAILQINADADGNFLLTDQLDLPFLDVFAGIEDIDVSRGDEVFFFGYPSIGDGYQAFTSGNISIIENGDIDVERMPVAFRTDAELAPGNSGGLAVAADGTPLGIPTAVRSETTTGGRFGVVLPFPAVRALIDCGRNCTVDLPPSVAGPGSDADPGTAQGNGAEEPAQTTDVRGMPDPIWTCDTGAEITNGTEITVIQMRSGFSYNATAIGIGDFDPVLMVVNTDRQTGFCNDDSADAAQYAFSFPTTGVIEGKSTDSRVTFSQGSGQALGDMHLVVGGFGGMGGEFVLILEGMAVTPSADGDGDPFAIQVTDSMVRSGVNFEVYMIGIDNPLDPLVISSLTVGEDPIYCDDAGTDTCWNVLDALEDHGVITASRQVPADAQDANISLSPVEAAGAGIEEVIYYMTSYNQASSGNYVIAFHVTIAPTGQ